MATEEQDTQADSGPPVDDIERGLLGVDVGGYTIDALVDTGATVAVALREDQVGLLSYEARHSLIRASFAISQASGDSTGLTAVAGSGSSPFR